MRNIRPQYETTQGLTIFGCLQVLKALRVLSEYFEVKHRPKKKNTSKVNPRGNISYI